MTLSQLLDDFRDLETYFPSKTEHAICITDLAKQYNESAINQAVEKGYISLRQYPFADQSPVFVELTDKGRGVAFTTLSFD